MIEGHPVHDFRGGRPVFRHVGQVDGVRPEGAPGGDQGVQRDTGLHRIFEVLLGVDALGEVAAQELQQPDGVVPVLRAFRHRGAADIDVDAPGVGAGLVRPKHLDFIGDLAVPGFFSGQQPCIVIIIGDRNIALARGDRAQLK